MINKRLLSFMLMLFVAAGTAVYSQNAKTPSKDSHITIFSQLSEVINKTQFEKITVTSFTRDVARGTEIKIISPDVLSIKSDDIIIYLNADKIIYFYVDGKKLCICI